VIANITILVNVTIAEPSPISTPLKKSLQRSSSPGKGESAISDITSQAERPSDIKVTNGHFLEEELPSSGKRPSLQGQSSEEAGLKTPGSTSETGPHSTPSSPSDQEFSDCQNHEFDYDLSTTDPVLSSSPKKQELTMEFASSANAIDETAAAAPVEVSRPNEIHQVICDTSNTVVDEEASDFKDTVEKITEENIYTSNRLDKDSLVNELTDSVENMNVGSQQNTGDKPESSVNRDSPAVHAEFSEAVSSNNLPIADEVEDSEDFGDFEAFPVSSFVSSDQTTDSSQNNHTNNEMKTSYIGEVNDEEDDGFGDFASTPRLEASTDCFPSTSNSKEPVVFNNELLAQPQSTQLDDDDFADFQDFQDAPSTSQAYSEPHPNPKIPSRSTSFSQSFSSPRMSADFTAALESKFDLLIKNVIPKDASQSSNQTNRTEEQSEDENREVVSEYNSIDKEIQGSSDTCWTHVQDFEESKGLLYKWLNSLSQQRMYKSLKIDASNIVRFNSI